MEAESLELMADRVSGLLDAACAVSSASAAALSSAEATVELQSRQQEELLAVYAALARRGELRGAPVGVQHSVTGAESCPRHLSRLG